jgi:cytidyltransferase-like protein
MAFNTGVVVGKFWPFHKGHHFLIDEALRQADEVYVIVSGRQWETPHPSVRAKWILDSCSGVSRVSIVYPEHLGVADKDSAAWANLTINTLGFVPDACFTSEDYGKRWAKEMGCVHISVDPERIKIPISGTEIRDDPMNHLDYLDPIVAEYYKLQAFNSYRMVI